MIAMPFSEFVIELGLEPELEVEWEKALEKEPEKDLRTFDGSCSWGRICVGGVVFYVVPIESRQVGSQLGVLRKNSVWSESSTLSLTF